MCVCVTVLYIRKEKNKELVNKLFGCYTILLEIFKCTYRNLIQKEHFRKIWPLAKINYAY